MGIFIPEGQGCCGIPALTLGDTDTFERLVNFNLEIFDKYSQSISESVEVNITKGPLAITAMSQMDIEYGLNTTLAFRLASSINETIAFSNQNVSITIFDKDSIQIFHNDTISNLSGEVMLDWNSMMGLPGTYNVCISSNGSNSFLPISNSFPLEVLPASSNLNIIQFTDRILCQSSDGNHFESIYMSDQDFAERNSYRFDENIFIKLGLNLPEFNESLELAMRLIDRNKRPVFTIHEQLQKYFDDEICLNLFIKIPNHFLVPGKYSWVICINHPGVRYYDLHDDILPFTVSETGSNFARYEGMNYGCVFVNHTIRKV